MKFAFVVFTAIIGSVAFADSGQTQTLDCSAPDDSFAGATVPLAIEGGDTQVSIIDGYASADLACGQSGEEIECDGFYFGILEHPVQLKVNLAKRTGTMSPYDRGRPILLRCRG